MGFPLSGSAAVKGALDPSALPLAPGAIPLKEVKCPGSPCDRCRASACADRVSRRDRATRSRSAASRRLTPLDGSDGVHAGRARGSRLSSRCRTACTPSQQAARPVAHSDHADDRSAAGVTVDELVFPEATTITQNGVDSCGCSAASSRSASPLHVRGQRATRRLRVAGAPALSGMRRKSVLPADRRCRSAGRFGSCPREPRSPRFTAMSSIASRGDTGKSPRRLSATRRPPAAVRPPRRALRVATRGESRRLHRARNDHRLHGVEPTFSRSFTTPKTA